MANRGQGARKPATKFPQLQKQMRKNQQSKIAITGLRRPPKPKPGQSGT